MFFESPPFNNFIDLVGATAPLLIQACTFDIGLFKSHPRGNRLKFTILSEVEYLFIFGKAFQLSA